MEIDAKVTQLLDQIRHLPRKPSVRRNPFLARIWFDLERTTGGQIEGMSVRAWITSKAVECGRPDNVLSVAKPFYIVLKEFVLTEDGRPRKNGIPEFLFDESLTRDECVVLAAHASDPKAANAMRNYFAVSKFSSGWIDFAVKTGQAAKHQ